TVSLAALRCTLSRWCGESLARVARRRLGLRDRSPNECGRPRDRLSAHFAGSSASLAGRSLSLPRAWHSRLERPLVLQRSHCELDGVRELLRAPIPFARRGAGDVYPRAGDRRRTRSRWPALALGHGRRRL